VHTELNEHLSKYVKSKNDEIYLKRRDFKDVQKLGIVHNRKISTYVNALSYL